MELLLSNSCKLKIHLSQLLSTQSLMVKITLIQTQELDQFYGRNKEDKHLTYISAKYSNLLVSFLQLTLHIQRDFNQVVLLATWVNCLLNQSKSNYSLINPKTTTTLEIIILT
jgi:hypothetical protein